jgi:hypothetical protein
LVRRGEDANGYGFFHPSGWAEAAGGISTTMASRTLSTFASDSQGIVVLLNQRDGMFALNTLLQP